MDDVDYLNRVRGYEAKRVMSFIPPAPCRILEIGAGTGQQTLDLRAAGYDVTPLEQINGTYDEHSLVEVIRYDGEHIPFPDGTFDVVFSSSVLEHVSDLDSFLLEMKRVTKPGGLGLHVQPNALWRVYTSLTHFLKQRETFIPSRHGERGNVLTECYYFSPLFWKLKFTEAGYEFLCKRGNRLFYTGYMINGLRLRIEMRDRLSRILGSVCTIYLLRCP